MPVSRATRRSPIPLEPWRSFYRTSKTRCRIDARWNAEWQDWEVYSHGGRKPTGIHAVEWAAEAERRGAGEIMLTSMDRDGTCEGYDLALLRAVSSATNIPIIASGGAGSAEHMVQALRPGHADAVLAATIFHFGELRVSDVKRHLAEAGLPVREVDVRG